MPPGRQPVKTSLVPPEKRADAYNFIRKQVTAGRQVFVICPLIQESDKLGVRSATQELEKLQRDVFPALPSPIALLHGRLKSPTKHATISASQPAAPPILVST